MGERSHHGKFSSGFPQGSNLDPLIYLAFIDNFPKPNVSECLGYADDYKFLNCNSSSIYQDLSALNDWLRYLGVLISKTLTWANKAALRVRKAKNALIRLKRSIVCCANQSLELNESCSYIVPIVLYASSVWKPNKVEPKLT